MKYDFLKGLYSVSDKVLAAAESSLERIMGQWRAIEETEAFNQGKVLKAFHDMNISDFHFAGGTGYGYGDTGRDALEGLYSHIFKSEAALVRPQIASGTHAIASVLFGILRPGDELLFATGEPYDTLKSVIGTSARKLPGNLMEMGVGYREVPLDEKGRPNLGEITSSINGKTKVVMIQRSCGYSLRPSLNVEDISDIVEAVRRSPYGKKGDTVIFVDNCYGEFVGKSEPIEAGADIIAGSLIKNPGGGMAEAGGYIVGSEELVELASSRLIAPGIGRDCGALIGSVRSLFQGLFMAPAVVASALKGAVFAAALFESLGFSVSPAYNERRGDIIQRFIFGSKEDLITFCRAIHQSGPVDAHHRPEPSPMPGYDDMIIMAGASFIQGSSIELSADAPLRPPYAAYLQGGITTEHAVISSILAASKIIQNGQYAR